MRELLDVEVSWNDFDFVGYPLFWQGINPGVSTHGHVILCDEGINSHFVFFAQSFVLL